MTTPVVGWVELSPLIRARRRGRAKLGSPIQGEVPCRFAGSLNGGRRKEVFLIENGVRKKFALLGVCD